MPNGLHRSYSRRDSVASFYQSPRMRTITATIVAFGLPLNDGQRRCEFSHPELNETGRYRETFLVLSPVGRHPNSPVASAPGKGKRPSFLEPLGAACVFSMVLCWDQNTCARAVLEFGAGSVVHAPARLRGLRRLRSHLVPRDERRLVARMHHRKFLSSLPLMERLFAHPLVSGD